MKSQPWIAFARANRRHLVLLLVSGLLVNVFALALPMFTMLVYDKTIGTGTHDTLVALMIGVALAAVLDLAVRWARVMLIEHAGAHWDRHFDDEVVQGILAAPLSRRLDMGTVLARYREVGAQREVLSAQSMLPLADLPFVLLMAGLIAAIGGPLVLVPCATIVLLTLSGAVFTRWSALAQRRAHQLSASRTVQLLDVLSARESLARPGAARGARQRLKVSAGEAAQQQSRARLWGQWSQQLITAAVMLNSVVLIGWGVLRIEAQVLTVGGLVSVSMLNYRFISMACGVLPLLSRWRLFRESLRQLDDSLQAGSAAAAPSDRGPDALAQEGVHLESVSVRLGGSSGRPALDQVTLRLKAGELVAVVGQSGAGKTSLLKLLAGQLVPDGGQFSVAGRTMGHEADRRWLAERVVYGPQEPAFLGGTLAEVLRADLNDEPPVDDAALLQALHAAGLGPAIQRGELGLNTPVGLNGAGLSGGQRHMLALARVLAAARQPLPGARLVLIDEPTNGLDRGAQEQVMSSVQSLRGLGIVLVATHAMELIQACDRVLVFDRGRLVADTVPARIASQAAPAVATATSH